MTTKKPKESKSTTDTAPPAELVRLRDLEHELHELLRRKSQTEDALLQTQRELRDIRRQRASVGHLVGTDTLDEARRQEDAIRQRIEGLEQDLSDMANGERTLKAAIADQERIARPAVMAWWRERKQALVERIRPLAAELAPLLGDLYQAVQGEALSSIPTEQFIRTDLLPLLFGGMNPPAGSVSDVPVSKYGLECNLLTDHERRVLREQATPARTDRDDIGPGPQPGYLLFDQAARHIGRELGMDGVAAKTVLSRALSDGRIKHIRHMGRVAIHADRLAAFIDELALERMEKAS